MVISKNVYRISKIYIQHEKPITTISVWFAEFLIFNVRYNDRRHVWDLKKRRAKKRFYSKSFFLRMFSPTTRVTNLRCPRWDARSSVVCIVSPNKHVLEITLVFSFQVRYPTVSVPFWNFIAGIQHLKR